MGGGQKIYNNEFDCNYIFIDAPSIEALEERLNKRGTEAPEIIQKRLNNARKEIEVSNELTYYNHIINDEAQVCYGAISAHL